MKEFNDLTAFEAELRTALKSTGHLFPTTDKEVEYFMAHAPKMTVPEKYRTPDFLLHDETGGENTFIIEKDGVHMEQANCPDKVCIHQGTIREGDIVPVTCLPNRLSLQIISEKSIPNGFNLKKQDYDSVRK